MNVIGSSIMVVLASDPTLVGRSGKVLLETKNTLVLGDGLKTIRIAKAGLKFSVLGTSTELSGSDLKGRLQDRWGSRS